MTDRNEKAARLRSAAERLQGSGRVVVDGNVLADMLDAEADCQDSITESQHAMTNVLGELGSTTPSNATVLIDTGGPALDMAGAILAAGWRRVSADITTVARVATAIHDAVHESEDPQGDYEAAARAAIRAIGGGGDD